ncbi:DUF692 family multinuclear iron-containing protein [Hydrogenophaga sp. 5NK40-0174]|uniref:DUF692 domain-containing protein n=1 Tax=Hydrogenophaga sp. 5NK40-0174 TaxID=3127649 RepID=UPI0033414CD8
MVKHLSEQTLPRLGVALAFQAPLKTLFEQPDDDFDLAEVVPDILWVDQGEGVHPRFIDDAEGMAWLRALRANMPVIPHGIGMSIGSARPQDMEHLQQLQRWHQQLQFPWHSDHLAFHVADRNGQPINTGVTLPLPRDRQTIEMIRPKVQQVMQTIPVPFLLENNVYYFDMPDEDMDEARFLNTLCAETGCGLLLDLHNIYTNAVNHGFDAMDLLADIDLRHVGEIHVAGGMTHEGVYLDAHSDVLPDLVWTMLEHALPRCPNVGAVTFELFGSWYDVVGEQRVRAELRRLKRIWADVFNSGGGALKSATRARHRAGESALTS